MIRRICLVDAHFPFPDMHQGRQTKMLGDYKLTRKVRIDELHMGGQTWPAGFTLVAPKKNIYFQAPVRECNL